MRAKPTFQKLPKSYLAALRDHVAAHGIAPTAVSIGLSKGGLDNALAGRGVFPSTLAKVATFVGERANSATPPPAAPKHPSLNGVAGRLREISAATALILEVLDGVQPESRARVLDSARAALG